MEPKNIAVLGLGYVGCVTAACLAEVGHRVTGVDRDQGKVSRILDGQAPFYEPGLEPLVRSTVSAGRFHATVSLAEALQDAEIALIAVGTPSDRNGNINLDQLRRVVDEIAAELRRRPRSLIVAVRSTVPPGTCEELAITTLAGCGDVAIVANPEFLREGSAVRDFMEPALLVVGGNDADAMRQVADIYAPLGVEPCLVAAKTAEMIKFACNAFHALKVTFANEIGSLCGSLGIDGREVMSTLCRDARLNISAAYLQPGFAFGGSCLAKDLRALTYRARCVQMQLPLLEATLPSNAAHLNRAVGKILARPEGRIGIIGLAFKENTDDLRESAAVALLERLSEAGRDLRVYDPNIRLTSIYGTNRSFILNAMPQIDHLIVDDLQKLLSWAECLVIAQKPSRELAAGLSDSRVPMVDLTGLLPER